MTTLAQAVGALKARAASQITMLGPAVYWDKDARPLLPADPAPFLFFLVDTGRARFPVATGGGRGNNLQRVEGELTGLLFLPKAWTLEQHGAYGEHVAAAFRSFRDEHVSCFAVTPQPAIDGSNLLPPGLESEVTNYDCTIVSVPFQFDQIG